MQKPNDIPEDVWADALARSFEFEGEISERKIVVAIARAILAERERCAKVAYEWPPVATLLPFADESHNEAARTGQHEASERIAEAILTHPTNRERMNERD